MVDRVYFVRNPFLTCISSKVEPHPDGLFIPERQVFGSPLARLGAVVAGIIRTKQCLGLDRIDTGVVEGLLRAPDETPFLMLFENAQ